MALDEYAAEVVAALVQGPIQGRPRGPATLHQLAGALFKAADRGCSFYMKHPLPQCVAYAPDPALSGVHQVGQDVVWSTLVQLVQCGLSILGTVWPVLHWRVQHTVLHPSPSYLSETE
jgi:hypothetical protein